MKSTYVHSANNSRKQSEKFYGIELWNNFKFGALNCIKKGRRRVR
jgi:hypothetical protein